MGRGNVRVDIRSTYDDKGNKQAESSLDRLQKRGEHTFSHLTKHALGYGAALIGGAGVVGGLEAVAEASVAAEKSQAKLDAQLKAVGISYSAHSKEIEDVLAKTSSLTGFLDKDLEEALASIVRSTGNLHDSYRLLGLATDVARAKNIDVASAGALVAKVQAGQTRVLKSLGIAMDPVTKAQDALKETTKHATDEQKRAAVADDKRATAQKALGLLQQRLGGQAKAYGDTTAGSLDKMKAAVDRLEVKLGNALAPTIQKVADKVSTFVTQMQTGEGAGGRFAQKMSDVAHKVGDVLKVVKDIAGWLKDHPKLLAAAGAAWLTYKVAAIAATAATKLALLGTFGGAVRRKMVTEAATTGAASGKALGGAEAAASAKASGRLLGAAALAGVIFYLQEHQNDSRPIWDRILNPVGPGVGSRRPLRDPSREKSTQPAGTPGGFHYTPPDARGNPKSPGHGIIKPHRRGKSASVHASASSVGGSARPTARASRTFSKSELMQLWISAGGPAKVADTAAAIALAESGGRSDIVNSIGASGLWQIYGLPFQGDPLDPMTNARMAVAKYKAAGGFSPWTTYTGADTGPGGGPGAKTYLQYTGGGTKPSGSVSGTAARRAPAPKSAYDKLQNQLGYIGLQVDAGTITEDQGSNRIIAAVNRALPRLHGSDRLRALGARRQARTDRRDRRRTKAENRATARQDYADRKATFYDRTLSNPWLQAYLNHQDYLAATGQISQAQADANKAGALQGAINSGQLSEADVVTATGQIKDLTAPADTGTGTASGEDPNQALIDAQNAAADAAREVADELKATREELEKQNKFAEQVTAVSLGQAWGALADVISGQIAGVGYSGRALTAGAGSVTRY